MSRDTRAMRRPPAKIEPGVALQLRIRYEQGATSLELASELDVHENAIKKAIRSAGGQIRNRIDAMRLARAGKPRSEEHCQRISASRKSAAMTVEGRKHLLAISKMGADAIRLTAEEREARNRARLRAKNLLHRALQVTGQRKSKSTQELLGYDWRQLRAHLELQFEVGMSWESPGSFHIDHKVPVVQFLKRGIFDPRVINALCNLQVMRPEENLRKSSSYDESRWDVDIRAIKEAAGA